ncbi:MAG: hypothetical protein IJS00_05090 [Paludibacteraceae bacterium]|nr:hypothetical protein [Paludibacteraceae bacterium]
MTSANDTSDKQARLVENVRALLSRFDALQEEVVTLRHTVQQQREEIIQTHSELVELQKQHRQLQTALALVGDNGQKEKARQEINYLIHLVDRALNTLKNE